MAKSKKSKVVPLTQTKKKGREEKSNLMDLVREAAHKYQFAYVIRFANMRNVFLKELRLAWKDSKIFLGKNNVMAKAFGRTPAEELKQGISGLANALTGNVGVLFSNKDVDAVREFFEEFSRLDFAREGSVATDLVMIPAGALHKGDAPFPHTLETQIRALGVPTLLQNGIVSLAGDYIVCQEGDVLTSEKARILKMFDLKMAQFQVSVDAVYDEAHGFRVLSQ